MTWDVSNAQWRAAAGEGSVTRPAAAEPLDALDGFVVQHLQASGAMGGLPAAQPPPDVARSRAVTPLVEDPVAASAASAPQSTPEAAPPEAAPPEAAPPEAAPPEAAPPEAAASSSPSARARWDDADGCGAVPPPLVSTPAGQPSVRQLSPDPDDLQIELTPASAPSTAIPSAFGGGAAAPAASPSSEAVDSPAQPTEPEPDAVMGAAPEMPEPLDVYDEEEPLPDPPTEDPSARGGEPEAERSPEDAEVDTVEVDEVEVDEVEVDEVDEVEEVEEVQVPPTPRSASRPPSPKRAKERARAAGAAERRDWITKGWPDEVFDQSYLSLLPDQAAEMAVADVKFILERLAVDEDARLSVLDVGSCAGHHCFAFSDAGHDPTGMDASLDILLRAGEGNKGREREVEFLRGDMRQMPETSPFDVVTCLGGTFGMFDDETNRHALAEMKQKLAPGGRLVLQVSNRDYLGPRMPCRSWWTGERCMVLDEAVFEPKGSRLQVKRTIVFEDGRQFEQRTSMRLYALHELGRLFGSWDAIGISPGIERRRASTARAPPTCGSWPWRTRVERHRRRAR